MGAIRSRPHLWLLSAWTLLSLAFAPVQQAGANVHITQVDTSRFPKVTVYVSVTDAAGEPVPVDPASIHLSENGKPVTTSAVDAVGQGQPLTTLLVFDVSGSMATAGKLDGAKAAARAYIGQMQPNDQAGVMAFNTQVQSVQGITQDHAVLTNAIDGLKAGGDTAMYDALYTAVGELEPGQGRKAVIVLTDGMDNRSQHTAREVIQHIGPGGLTISVVGLGDPSQVGKGLEGLDESALQSLADGAGGAYAFASAPDALKSIYERYGRVLSSEYAFTYSSAEPLRDGVNRSLSVDLTGVSGASAGQAKYNPGGLVPETAKSAPWALFIGLLAALVALLVLPGLIWRGVQAFQTRRPAAPQPGKKPGIRVHDPSTPRVRLH